MLARTYRRTRRARPWRWEPETRRCRAEGRRLAAAAVCGSPASSSSVARRERAWRRLLPLAPTRACGVAWRPASGQLPCRGARRSPSWLPRACPPSASSARRGSGPRREAEQRRKRGPRREAGHRRRRGTTATGGSPWRRETAEARRRSRWRRSGGEPGGKIPPAKKMGRIRVACSVASQPSLVQVEEQNKGRPCN